MAKCDTRVTVRNPYQLPPNTTDHECGRQAIGTYCGRPVCKLHMAMYQRHLERGELRQRLYRQKAEAAELKRQLRAKETK